MVRRPYTARRVHHPHGSVPVWTTGDGEVVIGRVTDEPFFQEEWDGWFEEEQPRAPSPEPLAWNARAWRNAAPRARPAAPPPPPPPKPRARKRPDQADGRKPTADSRAQRAAALRLLGLAEGATPAEAKRRYRQLCQERHPDRGGSTRGMAELNAAWEKLR